MNYSYPGYEIERFEDEGGNQCSFICFRPSSADKQEADDAGQEKRHEKHQEPEAVREAEG